MCGFKNNIYRNGKNRLNVFLYKYDKIWTYDIRLIALYHQPKCHKENFTPNLWWHYVSLIIPTQHKRYKNNQQLNWIRI